MPMFPFVPNAPGVPPVFRDAATTAFANQSIPFLTSDGPDIPSQAQQQPWGIYKDGSPVITADSTVSMDYGKDWVISDYQVEEGAFRSYNKVEEPYLSTVRMAAGGTLSNRQQFLDSIEQIAGDLEFYDVVTPEKTYINANIIRYNYRRTNQQGNGLMQVDIFLEEVRENAEQDFTQTAAPSGAATQNGGTVQTQQPTAQQQSVLSGLLN